MPTLLRRALALVLTLNLALAGGPSPAAARMLFDLGGTGRLAMPGLRHVAPPVVSAMTLAGTPAATTQYAPYGFAPARSGGTAPFSYALTAGTLPDGLTLAQNTGTISGRATGAPATASGLVVTVTDATGATAQLGPFAITVGASAPFALSQFPSASIVFDLDPTSGVTAPAGALSAWTAKAGTLTLGTATTAEQPTLVADGWSTGIPVVRFNGASSGNILRSSTGSFVDRRWTAFVAARPNADQNAVASFKPFYQTARLADGLNAQILLQRTNSDATQVNVYTTNYGGQAVAATGGFGKGTQAVIVDRAANIRTANVNGLVGASPSTAVGTTTRTQRMLGGSDDAVSSRAAIDIARVIEFDTDQVPGRSEELAKLYLIEGQLATLYGTRASLRTDQPYFSRAPVASDYRPWSRNVQFWGNSLALGTVGQWQTAIDAVLPGTTVGNGAIGGTNSPQILARFLANQDAIGGTASGLSSQAIREKIAILGELFQNDNWDGADTSKPQIDEATGNSYLAQMVAAEEAAQGVAAGQGRIIIWGQWEGNGLATAFDPTAVRARNANLRALYPNYFIDIHRVLANLAAPGAAYADADAWGRDAIPAVLRAGSGDLIHLSATGYLEVAKALVRFMLVRGWL